MALTGGHRGFGGAPGWLRHHDAGYRTANLTQSNQSPTCPPPSRTPYLAGRYTPHESSQVRDPCVSIHARPISCLVFQRRHARPIRVLHPSRWDGAESTGWPWVRRHRGRTPVRRNRHRRSAADDRLRQASSSTARSLMPGEDAATDRMSWPAAARPRITGPGKFSSASNPRLTQEPGRTPPPLA